MNMLTTLNKVMTGLAKNGRIFSNEQQFQFELAQELEKEGYEVFLEVASYDRDVISELKNALTKAKRKDIKFDKEYTDLIVKKSNDYYAIELKCKMDDQVCVYKASNGDVLTLAQGAKDFNAYDFLMDIKRLEHIKSRYFANAIQKHIKECFVIFLTNSSNKYRFNGFNGIWTNYAINEGRTIEGKLLICDKTGNETDTSYCYSKRTDKNGEIKYTKKEPIMLRDKYKITKASYGDNGSEGWHDYQLKNYPAKKNDDSKEPGFSYLILNVKSL